MNETLEKIYRKIRHYPWITIAAIIILVIFLWLSGCHPTTRSPEDPAKQINRTELQIVVNNFVERVKAADIDLTEKEKLRDYVTQTLLGAAQTGTINPVNVIAGVISILGIGAFGDNVRKDGRIKIQKQNIINLTARSNSQDTT